MENKIKSFPIIQVSITFNCQIGATRNSTNINGVLAAVVRFRSSDDQFVNIVFNCHFVARAGENFLQVIKKIM